MDVVVSVMMSTYNGEKYIGDAIKSVLSQSFSNFEFLITDDASTDSTVELIEAFKDNRIILIKNKYRKGLTANLIEMQKKAKGKYLARLDSDDLSDSHRIEYQVDFLNNNKNCVMVCSYAKVFGDKMGTIKTPSRFEDLKVALLFYNPIVHSSVMLRNNCNLFYDASFLKAQDYALWDYVVEKGFRIACIPKKLVSFRCHQSQISNNGKKEQNTYRNIIIRRALSRLSIVLDSSRENIWFRFLSGETNFSINEINLIVDVLIKIQRNNRKIGLYNQNALSKRLEHYYICLYLIVKRAGYRFEHNQFIKSKIPFYKRFIISLRRYMR